MKKTVGAVFQPELIELVKALLDEATATLPETYVGDASRDRFAHSGVCRERRARPGSAENGRSLGRRGMFTLFA
jgi:hypothetical protein